MKNVKFTGNIVTLVYVNRYAFQLYFAGQLVQPGDELEAKKLGMMLNVDENEKPFKNQPKYIFWRSEGIKQILREMISKVAPVFLNKTAQCLVIKNGEFKNYNLKPLEA
jgi:hypothetical protein